MLPDYFEFSLPTRVIYGIGVIDQLSDAVAHYGPRRACHSGPGPGWRNG